MTDKNLTEHTPRLIVDYGLCFVRCYCGWKGDEFPYLGGAWSDWIEHVDQVLEDQQMAKP
jgi:hypothetical protein